MRYTVIALPGLGLALSACEGAAEKGTASGGEAGPSADARRIEQMAEAERNVVFLRALRDGRHDCQAVISSRLSGEREGIPIWQADCRGGRSWFIAITTNGYAQIVVPGPAEAARGHANTATEE